MNEKTLCNLMRLAIILIGICGILSCLFWIPLSLGNGALSDLPWRSADFIIQYIFHWLVSFPCFGLLIPAWKITDTINAGQFFLKKNATYVNYATVILISDILAFMAGNIIFALLGWNPWLILQILITVSGLIITIFMYILSKYLMQAALLQEESDLTV